MPEDIITHPDIMLVAEPLVTREQSMARYLADHDLPGRYWKVRKKEKTAILDDAETATGYHRKSLIRLFKRLRERVARLAGDVVKRGKKLGRRPKYLEASKKTLRKLAREMRMSERKICGSMARWIPVAQKLAPIDLTERVIEDLLGMSSATIGRFLRGGKESHTFTPRKPRPKSKHQRATPLRTWGDWRDLHAGALQVDSVAHAGGRGGGGHLWTVTVIDVYSGWTDAFAIHRLTQEAVADALERMRERSPFRWFSVHTDNGSEFLNEVVVGWCRESGIEQTRGRPGKSNDQAHVENANKTFVRKLVGDHRYESARARDVLNDLYAVQRSISNFFEARQRLIGKRHKGRRTTRIYDKARMPDARLLDSGCLDQGEQEALRAMLADLDIENLLSSKDELLARLDKVTRRTQ